MFIFYVSDFFFCYSFFIFMIVLLPRRQLVHDFEGGFPSQVVKAHSKKSAMAINYLLLLFLALLQLSSQYQVG